MSAAILLDEAYAGGLVARVRARGRECLAVPVPLPTPDDLRALHDRADRYDPQRWFELFAHIRLPPGRVLDFVYHAWGNGGGPLLYVRSADGSRLRTPDEVRNLHPHPDAWQAALVPDGTPEGFFEAVVLARHAARFHLVWHAQAGEAAFVCDRALLRSVLGEPAVPSGHHFPGQEPLSPEAHRALLDVDVRPVVEPMDGVARVTLFSFVLPGGLSRQTYEVRAGQPVRRTAETMRWERRGGPVH